MNKTILVTQATATLRRLSEKRSKAKRRRNLGVWKLEQLDRLIEMSFRRVDRREKIMAAGRKYTLTRANKGDSAL